MAGLTKAILEEAADEMGSLLELCFTGWLLVTTFIGKFGFLYLDTV